MKNKILILLFLAISLNLNGCGRSETKNVPQDKSITESKADSNELTDTERYYYILNTKETYDELNDEDPGINALYIDKLINGEIDYDSKYEERVEELRKQKEGIDNSSNGEEDNDSINSEIDDLYKDVKVSDNAAQSTKEVNDKIIAELDRSKLFKKYKVKMASDAVTIDIGSGIKLSDVNKDALSNIAKNIYGYFKDAGLARTHSEVKVLHVYFIIDGKKFSSEWSLSKAQEDNWND